MLFRNSSYSLEVDRPYTNQNLGEVDEMAASGAKRDKHFPLFAHDNPLRRLFSSPRKHCPYVKQDQIVADLGCGPGYYALALAESVGAKGRRWGMIKAVQMSTYDSRYIGVDFDDVRYDQVAQAFGCYGERVEDPEEITPALERAVASGKPAVLDVVLDQWANLTPPDLENLDAVWMEGCELPW